MSTYKVLVTDNDEHVLSFMTDALEAEGYAVTSLPSNKLTLHLLKESNPQLVIVDTHQRTATTLLAILAQLGQDAATRHMSVLVTATSERDLRTAASALASMHYATLLKPFDLDLFFSYVHQLVTSRTSLQPCSQPLSPSEAV